MTLSEELHWRGFVNQTTLKDPSQLDGEPITFYLGVDPSAESMTIGNLAVAMMARHFIDYGHRAILLVGGATGLIGDPDGKAEERQLKTLEEVARNKQAIADEYRRVFAGQDFTLVDNYDWFKDIGYLDFLRDVGKHFSMTQLLDRDFVQSRIGRGGAGISYAEFSYTLIQGYDFLQLHRTHGATLQIAGADQWGNSISGVELIRKLEGKEAHVWTAPLVINKSTGKKFGKSEGGAVWLNPKLTSPFEFYQFWLKADDKGVEDYLKIYTLLGKAEIENLMREFQQQPANRAAQKALAFEVTKIVHGQAEAEAAKQATESLFAGVSDAIPQQAVKGSSHETIGLLVTAGLAESNSEARRLLQQGGVRLNQEKIQSDTIVINDGDILQAGKHRFVKLVIKL